MVVDEMWRGKLLKEAQIRVGIGEHDIFSKVRTRHAHMPTRASPSRSGGAARACPRLAQKGQSRASGHLTAPRSWLASAQKHGGAARLSRALYSCP
jgi:hypothetical protein